MGPFGRLERKGGGAFARRLPNRAPTRRPLTVHGQLVERTVVESPVAVSTVCLVRCSQGCTTTVLGCLSASLAAPPTTAPAPAPTTAPTGPPSTAPVTAPPAAPVTAPLPSAKAARGDMVTAVVTASPRMKP